MASQDFNMDNQWLPFTPNRHFRQDPRVFVAADGMEFTTHDGKKVIDGISSLWCVGAGHNRKPINEAIKKQLDTLDYATAFQASNDRPSRPPRRSPRWRRATSTRCCSATRAAKRPTPR
jgi:beta-alanine--pyruvate transaminase